MIETPNDYQLIYKATNTGGFVFLHPNQKKLRKLTIVLLEYF